MPKNKGKQRRQADKARSRRRTMTGIGLGLGALVAAVAIVLAANGFAAQRASAAPAWAAKTTMGEEVGSDAYDGHVYVMDFFFLTCGICEIQLPENKRMADAFANRSDFHLVSVTADPADTTPLIVQHQDEKNATWPHVRDTYGLYQKFKVRGNPNLVFVDREGNVALTVTDLAKADYLIEQAKRLLDGDAPTAPEEGDTTPATHDPGHGGTVTDARRT